MDSDNVNICFFVCLSSWVYIRDIILITPLDAIASVHYDDVTMGGMASQISSLTIVYSTVYSSADKKHQSPSSLASVRGIHRGPMNSPHKGPVTRKMFPFDDVIMNFTPDTVQIIRVLNSYLSIVVNIWCVSQMALINSSVLIYISRRNINQLINPIDVLIGTDS